MFKRLLILAVLFSLSAGNADEIIWKGSVNSDGSNSPSIKLTPGRMYQFKVTGTAVLGNWSKNGQPLINDANYEFNAVGKPTLNPVLKNSQNVSLGNGEFRQDHTYESPVFTAQKEALYFWVFDSNYGDNKGSFQVEVSQITPAASATVIWKGSVGSDGPPSAKIPLTVGKVYQIIVSGHISLGAWSKNGKQMMNDACYEYNAVGEPVAMPSFKSTLDISVCDGKYHPNHIYQSVPFKAEKEDISFWIFDTDYSDNSGSLDVQLNLVK